MNQYLPTLKKMSLFSGIDDNNILSLLTCLSAKIKYYQKEEQIIRSGEKTHYAYFVLSGTVLIVHEDFWGNRNILSNFDVGSLFAETYACLPNIHVEISALAKQDCTIMYLDINKLLTVCQSVCGYHTQIIKNFLSNMASKNLILTKKIEHLSKHTIRDRVLSYLSSESIRNQCDTFKIPYNRQQLADYLCVDRSALSNELSKLQAEGIIEFKKNHFKLMQHIYNL